MKQTNILIIIIFTISSIVFIECKNKTESNTQDQTQTDPSIENLNLWIKSNPKNDSLYFKRAAYYSKQELFDQAIGDLEKALSIDSTHKPKYYHALSEAHLLNFESKAALSIMDKALNYFPNDIETIIKSAKLKLILKQHMSALATLDKVFIRDPQNANAFYLAGHIFYEMGDTGRAVNSYQKAVDNNPDLREGWIRLGDVLTELKNPKALSYYDNAIRMDSLDAETWHNKAYALGVFGKKLESLNLYKNICIRFPSYEPAFFNLGMLYKQMDSIPQAINQFTTSIQINPAEPTNYYQRGLCYLKSADKIKAKEDFSKAVNLEPEFTDAKKELAKL